MYVTDTLTSFQMAKGFTKHNRVNKPSHMPENVIAAHEELKVKRKLNLSLTWQTFRIPTIRYFVIIDKGKTGKWLSPKIVLTVDIYAPSVIVRI